MRPDLISVDPALLKQFMLDDLFARTAALMEQRLPEQVEQQLPDDDARAGYFTRLAEIERFEAARRPMPWLASLLDGHDPRNVASELARQEPAGKPAPDDPAAKTWQVPGPGGHVRYFLAARWSEGDDDRRRAWLYGFFLRCCEESLGP